MGAGLPCRQVAIDPDNSQDCAGYFCFLEAVRNVRKSARTLPQFSSPRSITIVRMTSIEFDSLAVNFLDCVKKDERPYRRLADLLMALHSLGWSSDELLRIQSVFCEAITQHRYDGPPQQSSFATVNAGAV